ncbi:MAG: hypothetical protein JSV89_18325 [Spirochaetaceae bacterium]|nr:MAG: hypothetical protein JSV89_18325 [Spirochaetaceae bacterium]
MSVSQTAGDTGKTPFIILQASLPPLDPHTCTDADAVRSWRFSLYEALVENEGERFAPLLAESWRCSQDARTWTFTLSQGVRFHDGTPLTARDVAYSLTRAAGPLITGELFAVSFHSYLAGMELETPDHRTVVLHAPEPTADLLDLICDMVIVPEGALADPPLEAADPQSARRLPPGTGPYRLESFGQEVAVLRAWERYWRGVRKQQVVEFRSVPAEIERVEALQGGVADLVTRLNPDSVPKLAHQEACELWPLESSLCVIYLMNLSSGYLGDVRVRQALNYAADKQTIIREILHGQAAALNGPLSNLHFGFDPEVPAYPCDRDRARNLVAEAGLEGQEVVLHTPLILPDEASRLTEMLARQLGDIGIAARIEQHGDRQQYARRIAHRELGGLCCFDSSPSSTFRVLREKLDSRVRGPWWQGYHSDPANDLLSRAAATADVAARQALYRQACRIYRNEAPWLFLYQPRRLWGIRCDARPLVRAGREGIVRFL